MASEPAADCRPGIGPVRCLGMSVIASGILAVTLVAATAAVDGLGQAEKAATSLAMPVGLIWLLLFAGGVGFALQRRLLASLFLMAIWLLMGATFNGQVARWFVKRVETAPTTLPPGGLPLRAVVVLGGGVGVAPDGKPQLGSDGQRILSAAQMWHAGEARTIICTGTTTTDQPGPSVLGRQVLESIGVPSELVYESPGDNTSEEFQNLNRFLTDPPAGFPSDGKIGLITSAFHMDRALRLAAKNEVDVIPLPCCFAGASATSFSPRQLVPTAAAGKSLAKAMKEMLARFVGR